MKLTKSKLKEIFKKPKQSNPDIIGTRHASTRASLARTSTAWKAAMALGCWF